jgi:hypothetical protein
MGLTYTRHNQNARDRVVELHKDIRLIHLHLGDSQYVSKWTCIRLEDFPVNWSNSEL